MTEIPEIVRTFKWDENLDVKDKHIILGKLLAYQDIEEYCKTIRESYTRLLKVNNTESEEQLMGYEEEKNNIPCSGILLLRTRNNLLC